MGVGTLLDTTMDGHVFPNEAIFADVSIGLRTLEVEILWFVANVGPVEDFRAFSNGGVAREVHVRADGAVVTNLDIWTDDGKWTDGDILAQLGTWSNCGTWIDVTHRRRLEVRG